MKEEVVNFSEIEGLPLLFKFLNEKEINLKIDSKKNQFVWVEAYNGYTTPESHYKPISKIIDLDTLKDE
jgi:hypothetical protein